MSVQGRLSHVSIHMNLRESSRVLLKIGDGRLSLAKMLSIFESLGIYLHGKVGSIGNLRLSRIKSWYEMVFMPK